jgi:hypothetical protein
VKSRSVAREPYRHDALEGGITSACILKPSSPKALHATAAQKDSSTNRDPSLRFGISERAPPYPRFSLGKARPNRCARIRSNLNEWK